MKNKGFTPFRNLKKQNISEKSMRVKFLTGFTLIELMVVVSIISLLSVIIFANYRSGERQLALQRSAYQLAQDLRRVQGMAMATREFEGEVPPRYGIEFTKDQDSYILFTDINDNGKYEPGGGNPDRIVETIYLEKGAWVGELRTPSSKTTVWVTFKPPDPLTTIRDPGEREILRIQLTNLNNQTKIISLNKAGLIEVE